MNLSFDTVLRVRKIINDKSSKSAANILKAIKYLVRTPVALSINQQAELLTAIFDYISDLQNDIDNYNYTSSGKTAKYLDYDKDLSAIYAAFMQTYNIDLFGQQGKLHWLKFLMLLNNIPDDTRLSKIIGYRAMDIPPVDKYNAERRNGIIELKNIYALEASEAEKENNINMGLASMFSAMFQA